MAEADKATGKFGTCCNELKEAMAGEDFEPLVAQGDDGVLYLTVGLVDLDDDEAGMVDHPMYFCPFCRTRLQTEDEVQAKIEANSDSDEDQAYALRRQAEAEEGTWLTRSSSSWCARSACSCLRTRSRSYCRGYKAISLFWRTTRQCCRCSGRACLTFSCRARRAVSSSRAVSPRLSPIA